MTLDFIKQQIGNIKVNKRNGELAVYKPLLLILILEEVESGGKNEFAFVDFAPRLSVLMEKYGWPTISRKKAEYPFFFLASSDLWSLNISQSDLRHPDVPSSKEMEGAVGKLNSQIYLFLSENRSFIPELIEFIKKRFSLPAN